MMDKLDAIPGSAGRRIIDGLRDAVAGNFSAVVIDGKRWVAEKSIGWQPIETAPRDGTYVIVSEASRGSVGEAYYDNYGSNQWWWANTSDGDHPMPHQPYPTHWMPLPDAPEIE